MTSQAAVSLDGVSRSFRDGPRITNVLKDLHMEVPRGSFVSVVGPSGSGKTTLLNVLGLLDKPTAGRYLLDGMDTTQFSELERSHARGSQIGFVFQDFHLLSNRSVLRNVLIGLLYTQSVATKEGRYQLATDVLEQVGMSHRLSAKASTLSGGEKQRVAIARALVNRPSVLLCDEPTGNLDSRRAKSVLELLSDLNARGSTVILITHDLAAASQADRRFVLRDGQLSE